MEREFSRKRNINWLNSALIWALGTSVAWALVQYAGIRFSMTNGALSDWNEVGQLIGQLAMNGALLGGISGALQALIVGMWSGNKRSWLFTTFVAYLVGLPLGFLLSVLVIWANARSWQPGLLAGDSSSVIYFPVLLSMLFTGAVIAIFQWLLYFRNFGKFTATDPALWVLGNAISWAIGFVASSGIWSQRLPFFLRQGLAGGIIGLLIGLLFLWQVYRSERIGKPVSISNI